MAAWRNGWSLVRLRVVNGTGQARYCAPWPTVVTWKAEADTPARTIGSARLHHQVAAAMAISAATDPTRPSTAQSVDVAKLSPVEGKNRKTTDDHPPVPPAGLYPTMVAAMRGRAWTGVPTVRGIVSRRARPTAPAPTRSRSRSRQVLSPRSSAGRKSAGHVLTEIANPISAPATRTLWRARDLRARKAPRANSRQSGSI